MFGKHIVCFSLPPAQNVGMSRSRFRSFGVFHIPRADAGSSTQRPQPSTHRQAPSHFWLRFPRVCSHQYLWLLPRVTGHLYASEVANCYFLPNTCTRDIHLIEALNTAVQLNYPKGIRRCVARSPFAKRGDGVSVRRCTPLCTEVFALLGSKVGDRIELTEVARGDADPLTDRRACFGRNRAAYKKYIDASYGTVLL